MEIKHNQVVVKKENRGDECSKLLSLNYTVGTEVLKPGLGATKRFIQRSKDGKGADAGNTNNTCIQEFFHSNLTKVDSLEHCVVSCYLNDILRLGSSITLCMLTLK